MTERSYDRTKFDALDGTTKVSFVSTEETSFELTASRRGVLLQGELLIETEAELQAFAKVVTEAWKEHKRLLPKISTTLSGH